MEADNERGKRDTNEGMEARGDNAGPKGHKSGLRISIQIEPEPADRPEPRAIEPVWVPTTSGPFEYDPYGVRPQPENAPLAEPAWQIAWGFSAPSPLAAGHFPGRCTCGGTLPPGRWIETDPVEYVDDATKYPLAPRDSEGEDEFSPPPASPDQE